MIKQIDKLNKNYRIFLSTILIGVGAGFFSFLIHSGVDKVRELIGTNQVFTLKTTMYSLLFVTGSYLLTKYIFKDTNGSGIPQVKLALVAYKGRMTKRMPLGKFITSVMTLVSGLPFGKEGPLVTMSASWGHLVCHFFNLNRQMTKVLVASGAAAGLAAAFNTPIAAVIFTVEELLGELKTKYLGPIIVTSVIASVSAYKLHGNHSTFSPVHYKFHIEWHLLLYAILGISMAIIGHSFVKQIILFKNFKKKVFKEYDLLYIVLVVLVFAVATQFVNGLPMNGIDTINNFLLNTKVFNLQNLAVLFVVQCLLTTSAYSTGLSGGIFMPTLLLGAIGGYVFGSLFVHLGIGGIEVGAFALLGMTSLLVSVIRAPFTAFVLLFEMTQDYELILPLMVSSISAYALANYLNENSVYEEVSEYEGVHIPTNKDNETLADLTVEECMTTDIVSLDGNKKVKDVCSIAELDDYSGYPVLVNGKLTGIVNNCELREYFTHSPDLLVSKIAKYSVIYVYPDQSLLIALDKMKRFNLGRLPVVSRHNQTRLVGLITPEDIINHLGLSKNEQTNETEVSS